MVNIPRFVFSYVISDEENLGGTAKVEEFRRMYLRMYSNFDTPPHPRVLDPSMFAEVRSRVVELSRVCWTGGHVIPKIELW